MVPRLSKERKGRLGLKRLGMAKVVWIRCAFVPVVVSRRGLGSSCPPCRPARTGRPSMGQTLYREGKTLEGAGTDCPQGENVFLCIELVSKKFFKWNQGAKHGGHPSTAREGEQGMEGQNIQCETSFLSPAGLQHFVCFQNQSSICWI